MDLYVPHILFSGSIIFSMYHRINRHLGVFADKCTSILHNVLPLKVQHTLRENRFIRILNDSAVYSVALTYAAFRPTLIFKHFRIGNHLLRVSYGTSDKNVFELFRCSKEGSDSCSFTSNRATVLFFMHGGAWGCGEPWQYRLVADGIGTAIEADFVVTIGFPTYPDSLIIDQRECIGRCLQQMHKTLCERYSSLEQYDIVLCGHSSGAATCALFLAEYIRQQLDRETEADSELWRRIKVFIGLSGPYDIVKHYEFEKARGVHEISPLKPAAGGLTGLASCSATLLLQQYAKLPFSSPLHVPYIILLHGTEDRVVPITSTEEYASALRHWNVPGELLKPKIAHMEPLLEGALYVLGGKSVTMQLLTDAWSNYRDVQKHRDL